LLFTQSLINCRISVRASPGIIYVDVPTEYSSIQEAINNADSGDTIFVHTGIYVENVVVNKSVALVGENLDFTIIDGNRTGNVIFILESNVSIKGFTIMNSGTHPPPGSGILIDQRARNVTITENKMINNYDGVSLHSSSGNEISNNMFINNDFGVSFYSSTNNQISGNTFVDNTYGVSFYSSTNNQISGNTLINNTYGVSFYSSTNNQISGNTLINNTYGMHFAYYSSDNVVYNNNFGNNNFGNVHQVLSEVVNSWSYNDEGNFWSDYIGHDLNEDGIGDNPYIIDQSNQDNHPLMGMFYFFNVALGKEQHYATFICNSTISNLKFEIGTETGNKIISFNVAGEEGTVGFCRSKIPTKLMNYSFIVLIGEEEIIPTTLDISNASYNYLYFTYVHSNSTVTIISSKMWQLYNQLLGQYEKLQIDFQDLNATYHELIQNFTIILGNYTMLQEKYGELNNSYQKHLLNYSENVNNLQNLLYIFAATTAMLIITIIYLSKSAHASVVKKKKAIEED
jgi:parallel beta-helix repeat protein